MIFNSLSFAIFLPIVFIAYWALPHKYRWLFLLLTSYWFYMSWNVRYVLLILFTTVVSYGMAIALEKEENSGRKKAILIIGALLCLSVLFFFKYYVFVGNSVIDLLGRFSIHLDPITLHLLLPVGVSFYTFQTLGYVIDVYKGKVPAEHHFGYYATFVSFFPQLVAGPIERTNSLLPQIKERHYFDYEQATYGLKLMAWGYYKKLVIADAVSAYVSHIYDSPQKYAGFSLVLATLLFSIQIYCDFSGYSDIAIGTAKLFGITLTTNFRSPYFSDSIKEFWRRWHISLSTWLRDYVYIPLGGNQRGRLRNAGNLLITFLVSGLWHGANWTFVVWGGIHGVLQILEEALVPDVKRKNAGRAVMLVRMFIVFVLVTFAWIFFVSHSIGDAFYVIAHMREGVTSPVSYIYKGIIDIGISASDLIKVCFTVLILAVYDYLSLNKDVIECISRWNVFVRWAIYVGFTLVLVFFSHKGVAAEFVYFQF